MNDKSKQRYRLSDEQQRQRVSDFENCENPTDRRAELAQARALLEQAINQGSTSVAATVLNVIDRLAKNQFRQDLVTHQLLTAPAVLRFGGRIVEIVADVVSKHFPDGWEDCLVEISEEIGGAFELLENDAADIESLRLPR